MFELLQKRSDGAYETPSGKFAVSMIAKSGILDNGIAWFEYKPTMTSEIVRVEWYDDAELALLDQKVARYLVTFGYARGITDDQMQRYNDAVNAENAVDPSLAVIATVEQGDGTTPKPGDPDWVKPEDELTPPAAPDDEVKVVEVGAKATPKEPAKPAEPEKPAAPAAPEVPAAPKKTGGITLPPVPGKQTGK